MKRFELNNDPDRIGFKNWGQVEVWCKNESAPSEPRRAVLGDVKVVGRYELVLVDGIECEARQIEPAVSKDKTETRFLAVKVVRDMPENTSKTR